MPSISDEDKLTELSNVCETPGNAFTSHILTIFSCHYINKNLFFVAEQNTNNANDLSQ